MAPHYYLGQAPVTAAPGIDISVVIPAYNEALRLDPTLDQISDYLNSRQLQYELLVVDDGSCDETANLVMKHPNPKITLLSHGRNLGKGAAVRCGVLKSTGAVVLITDADLSTPIEELEKLEPYLAGDQADLVLGSRAVQTTEVRKHQPLYRELMGRTFNVIIQILGVRGVRDTQCGFKLLRGRQARDLFQRLTTSGFAFDVELVWLAQREGLRVREVGVVWINSLDSKVRIWIDPFKMIIEVVLFRWRHRRTPQA